MGSSSPASPHVLSSRGLRRRTAAALVGLLTLLSFAPAAAGTTPHPTPHATRHPAPAASSTPSSRAPSAHRTHPRSAPSHRARPSSPPATSGSCRLAAGTAHVGSTWPQTRLGFQRVWPLTRGAGVRVAVIDTGLNTSNPQLAHLHLAPGVNVIGTSGTADCDGHGTEVTSIIAAQQIPSSAFVGVAPDATIVPIKQTNKPKDGSGTAAGLARGIDAAVQAHAQVANVSLTVPRDYPVVRQAIERAAGAGLIIVAAVGNNGQHGNRPTWPAKYSTEFPNVIAVSASNQADTVPPFPEHGSYVDVAAPGIGFAVPAPHGGFTDVQGTSFAAPYVTGTVALMLAAHHGLSPAAVKRRLALTADAPPTVTVPDPRFGYGILDSYLAVAAVPATTPAAASSAGAAPVPAPVAPAPPDRHVQHVALAAVAVLLALAALVVTVAAVVRRGAASRQVTR